MDDKYKILVNLLTNEISKVFTSFLLETIKSEIYIDKILNIVISSHLSSMFTSMKFISSIDISIDENVDKFIHNLTNFLCSSSILDNYKHMH